MDWWITVMVLGYLAFIVGIVWLILYYKLQKSRRQGDERLRVLERFSSGAELTDFLNSPAGGRLLDILSGQRPDPRRSAPWAISIGTFLLILGGGFLLLDFVEALGEEDIFLIPGMILAASGLGILLSAILSLRLARRLGVGRPETSEALRS
jgi:hypothetical protein